MAMETKRGSGRASDRSVSHARQPVNALDAAKRAAHAKPEEREHLRAAAAGRRRAVSHGAAERSGRALSFAAALVGIALAAVVIYLIGSALTGVAHHRDGAAAGEAELTVSRSSEGTAKKSIEYGGFAYRLSAKGDGCVLQRYPQGSEDESSGLCEMDGSPVGVIEYSGTVYAVSTTDADYRVASLALGDGCVPVELAQADGCVKKAELSDGVLKLELRDGTMKTIEL